MGRVDSHRRRMAEMKAILAVTTLESETVTRHDSSWPSATNKMTPEFIESEPPLSRDAPMKSRRGQTSAVLYSRTSACVSRSLSLKSTVREGCQHHKMAAAKTSWCSRLPCGPGGCATRKLHGRASAGCGPPANSRVTRLKPEPDVLSRCAKQASSLITSFSAVWRWTLPFIFQSNGGVEHPWQGNCNHFLYFRAYEITSHDDKCLFFLTNWVAFHSWASSFEDWLQYICIPFKF